MGMDQRAVVVFALVIVGSMLELTEDPARVVVRDVVVVVRVHDAWMGVLVLFVADDMLAGDRLLLHRRLRFCATTALFQGPAPSSCSGSGRAQVKTVTVALQPPVASISAA
jgi:hypothetical protein